MDCRDQCLGCEPGCIAVSWSMLKASVRVASQAEDPDDDGTSAEASGLQRLGYPQVGWQLDQDAPRVTWTDDIARGVTSPSTRAGFQANTRFVPDTGRLDRYGQGLQHEPGLVSPSKPSRSCSYTLSATDATGLWDLPEVEATHPSATS